MLSLGTGSSKAAANGCSLLSGLELKAGRAVAEKDPSLLTLLGELAQASLGPRMHACAVCNLATFSGAGGLDIQLVLVLLCCLNFPPQHPEQRWRFAVVQDWRRYFDCVDTFGADFALGDAVEFDNAGAITDGRVVLLEEDQALVRETMNGRIRIVKHRDLFPPGSRQAMAHHRALLGLAHDAGAVEATKAFRRLAKQHHPDKGGDPEMFRRLRVAFEALTLSTSTAVEKSPCRSAAKSKPSKASDADSPRTPEGPRRRLRQKTPPEGMRKDHPVPDMEGPAPKRHCRRERTKHTAADDKKEGEVAQELTVNGIMQLIWLFAVGPKSHA
ncbi:unnamed protein product [Cladocopium goreaui]|uniref:J domain-containing protein n=1 Tax=Cladocopium goreaui TaxID=2562237 RepID=A0A9P1GKA8_9DINO|nr:unnamed protein product [Cladocopium goreaui]